MAPFYGYCNASYTNATVWTKWVQTTTATSYAVTNQYAWTTWVDQTQFTNGYLRYVETPEEMARVEALRREEQVRHTEAQDRALGLFRESLTPEQLDTFERDKVVHIRSRRGRRYRIHCRDLMARDDYGLGNIDVLDGKDVVTARLCAHPQGLPAPDMWLAQLLSLEHNEEEVIRVANVHYGKRPVLAAA